MAEREEDQTLDLRPRPFAERLKGSALWLVGIVALGVIWLIGWSVVQTSQRQAEARRARAEQAPRALAGAGRVPGFLRGEPEGAPLAPAESAREPIVMNEVPAFASRAPREARARPAQDLDELARLSDIVPAAWKNTGTLGAGEGSIPPPGAARQAVSTLLGQSEHAVAPVATGAPGENLATPIVAAAQPASRLPVLPRGAVIPVTLARGIHTDRGCYPVAVVRRPVYSRDGELVIAAGSLLHGACAGSVVHGINRLFVRWDRIDTPEGERLDLSDEGFPGGALDGSAGMEGKLATHFWHALRDATLISVLAAGAQLAQPEGERTGFGNAITDRQIVAAAIAQELSRTAVEQLRRNLSRPHTITMEEGARFNVVLNRDLIFAR